MKHAAPYRLSFRTFWLTSALLLSLATAGVPVWGIMYNRDVGDAKSRQLASKPQFDSKASLGADGCTAVMIAPDAALSAAHCVGYRATGRTQVIWNGHARSGTFWKDSAVDLIVVKLDKPIAGARCTAPYAGSGEAGQLVWKVGHGGHGVLGPDSTKVAYDFVFRAMTNRIEVDRKSGIPAVTPTELHYDFDGPPTQPYTQTGTPYEGGTAPGDSGGPLYMQENGKWYVVGVTSGPRDNFYADGRVSRAMRLIKEKTGDTWAVPTSPLPVGLWTIRKPAANLNWKRNGADSAKKLWTLSAASNPIAGKTAFSVIMAVHSAIPTADLALLTANGVDGTQDWSVTHLVGGGWQFGIGGARVKTAFGAGSGWHILAATWDGAEDALDGAGENMKLYVDTASQVVKSQGPSFLNVARPQASLSLIESLTPRASAPRGQVLETRLYTGALTANQIDVLMRAMRRAYVENRQGRG